MQLDSKDISSVEFDGVSELTITYKVERKLNRFLLPVGSMTTPGFGLNWLYKEGFSEVITSWAGYGYVKRNNQWFIVDLQNKEVQQPSEDPRLDKKFLLGHVIPEQEWNGQIAEKIPFRRRVCGNGFEEEN